MPIAKSQSQSFAAAELDGEGWRTIGAVDHHGGTAVHIGPGGTIDKGPATLQGRKPHELGKKHSPKMTDIQAAAKAQLNPKTAPAVTTPAVAAKPTPAAQPIPSPSQPHQPNASETEGQEPEANALEGLDRLNGRQIAHLAERVGVAGAHRKGMGALVDELHSLEKHDGRVSPVLEKWEKWQDANDAGKMPTVSNGPAAHEVKIGNGDIQSFADKKQAVDFAKAHGGDGTIQRQTARQAGMQQANESLKALADSQPTPVAAPADTASPISATENIADRDLLETKPPVPIGSHEEVYANLVKAFSGTDGSGTGHAAKLAESPMSGSTMERRLNLNTGQVDDVVAAGYAEKNGRMYTFKRPESVTTASANDANKGADNDSSRNTMSRKALTSKLVDWAEKTGAFTDEQTHANMSDATGGGYQFRFRAIPGKTGNARFPGEIRNLLEGPNGKRYEQYFKIAADGETVNGEDATSQMGGYGKTAEAIDSMVGDQKSHRLNTAMEAAMSGDDPEMKFYAELLNATPTSTSAKRGIATRAAAQAKKLRDQADKMTGSLTDNQVMEKRKLLERATNAEQRADTASNDDGIDADVIAANPDGIPVWSEYAWKGHTFRVIEDEDGVKMVTDGDTFTPFPAAAVGSVPMDKGSLKATPEPELPGDGGEDPFGDLDHGDVQEMQKQPVPMQSEASRPGDQPAAGRDAAASPDVASGAVGDGATQPATAAPTAKDSSVVAPTVKESLTVSPTVGRDVSDRPAVAGGAGNGEVGGGSGTRAVRKLLRAERDKLSLLVSEPSATSGQSNQVAAGDTVNHRYSIGKHNFKRRMVVDSVEPNGEIYAHEHDAEDKTPTLIGKSGSDAITRVDSQPNPSASLAATESPAAKPPTNLDKLMARAKEAPAASVAGGLAKPVQNNAALNATSHATSVPATVDPSKQLGLFAKDAKGNAMEVGEKIGQANLFGRSQYAIQAKPGDDAVRNSDPEIARIERKFKDGESATPSMFEKDEKTQTNMDKLLSASRKERDAMAGIEDAANKQGKTTKKPSLPEMPSGGILFRPVPKDKRAQSDADHKLSKAAKRSFSPGERVSYKHHKTGEAVNAITDEGGGYVENGKMRYTVYPPGKKTSLGYHVWVDESALKSRESAKPSAVASVAKSPTLADL